MNKLSKSEYLDIKISTAFGWGQGFWTLQHLNALIMMNRAMESMSTYQSDLSLLCPLGDTGYDGGDLEPSIMVVEICYLFIITGSSLWFATFSVLFGKECQRSLTSQPRGPPVREPFSDNLNSINRRTKQFKYGRAVYYALRTPCGNSLTTILIALGIRNGSWDHVILRLSRSSPFPHLPPA